VLKRVIKSRLFIAVYLLGASLCAQAQVRAGGGGVPPPPQPARPVALVQASANTAPQVVTVVHRLSGMKVLSLLHRGGQSPMIVGDEFVTARDMLTSVTAGFPLGDGKSIIARLPQAEAAFAFNFSWPAMPAPPAPFPQKSSPAIPATPATRATPVVVSNIYPTLPELQVIQRDGKTTDARYIGLDAGTGLSLMQIEGLSPTPARDAVEEQLGMGQRVRLLAPQRMSQTTQGNAPSATPGKLYLAVGEIDGRITELKRSSNGNLSHLTVRAPKLSSAYTGGVALNDAGETIGLVLSSSADEARVMPIQVVRRAAARVLARRGNVPQPWLGVRGQAVAVTPLAQFLARGWSEQEAAMLQAKRGGIFLTAVAPNTPAAQANLRSGDVIVKLNEDEVKSAEDFSFMLNEAGSGATVNFTVLRRDQLEPAQAATARSVSAPLPRQQVEFVKPVIVSVKLSESLNPARWTWDSETRPRASSSDPLAAAGVESLPLSAKAAARLGASGGLLVVFVGQDSAASRAGLRVFDILEAVNNQLLSTSNIYALFNPGSSQPQTFTVVREGKKLSISFALQATKKQQ
jgi:S1-C subfamily serine protease